MAQPVVDKPGKEPEHLSAADASLAHMVDEIKEVEGLTGKGRWIRRIVVVLVVAIGVYAVWYAQQHAPATVVTRAEGVALTVYEPMGKLTFPPKYFRWQSVTGRSQYVLAVGTAPGKSDVLEKTVRSDSALLDEGEVKVFTPGRTYHWSVKALSKAGKTIGHGEGSFSL